MNWIDRLLMWIFRFFVIENAAGDPYMVRYKLVRFPFLKVYLHHILRSDEDPDLHDHPWSFVSIILWEGYFEFLSKTEWPRRIRAGSIVRHRAEDAHRLILEKPAWTLVFTTGKKRKWGFYADEGWMPYDAYFDRKYGKGQWVSF